jgi:hypothetical protein
MRILTLAVLGVGVLFAGHAYADVQDITPSFAGAPTGWTVDRQVPESFSDIGTFQGQHNVLGIGLGTGPTSASFYNTQGEGIPISGGAGSSVSALLYIPSSWNSQGAPVRTDMWAELNTSAVNPAEGNNTTYAIIGYTNYGSQTNASQNYASGPSDAVTGFRYFDDGTGQWVNLSAPVNYGAWNELSIVFTGSEFDYYVNGALAGIDTTDDSATGFNRLIMQGYEFYNVGGVPTPTAYTADWANVPEPGSTLLLGAGLAGLGAVRWRKSRRKAG